MTSVPSDPDPQEMLEAAQRRQDRLDAEAAEEQRREAERKRQQDEDDREELNALGGAVFFAARELIALPPDKLSHDDKVSALVRARELLAPEATPPSSSSGSARRPKRSLSKPSKTSTPTGSSNADPSSGESDDQPPARKIRGIFHGAAMKAEKVAEKLGPLHNPPPNQQ